MRFTHEAQLMPSMGSWISAEATGGGSAVSTSCILPGSIFPIAETGNPWHSGRVTSRAAPRRSAAPVSAVAAFATCRAPWGPIHVAATAAGVVAVDLGSETAGFVDGLAPRLRGPVIPAEDGSVPPEWHAALDAATNQIGEYLAGRRSAFDLPIDLRVSDWDRLVLTGAARIPFGETASYGELARRIGRFGAARAVGGAMGRNPVSILIPCHRVIGANGALGGYGGATYADRGAALAIKRHLLAIEGSWPAEAADAAGPDPD